MKCKLGFVGVGKMGLSHLSIANAHSMANVIAMADPSAMVQSAFKQFSTISTYSDYNQMFKNETLDGVVISVPTKYHEIVVSDALENGLHVFVEKPFTLNLDHGLSFIRSAKQKQLINQVGYHNKFIGTFREAKRLLDHHLLGSLTNFEGRIVGPVLLKKKEATWRSSSSDGGGCLMDYAAHLIDLVNYLVGNIEKVLGADLISIYSTNVDDAVYAILNTENGIHGSITANWSDETYRKMHTALTISGTEAKMEVDATELKIYFKNDPHFLGYEKGWNIKSINTLSGAVEFYLRGEEYSIQMDHFIRAIHHQVPNNINTFESAHVTDQVLSKIKQFKKA
jgi:predicted dehydrogenase